MPEVASHSGAYEEIPFVLGPGRGSDKLQRYIEKAVAFYDARTPEVLPFIIYFALSPVGVGAKYLV